MTDIDGVGEPGESATLAIFSQPTDGSDQLEICRDLTTDEARSVTSTIRRTLEVAISQITKAYNGRAWVALGYSSWADYCHNEFGEHIRLPRDARREAVTGLRAAGLSTRAIASATGAARNTVKADLQVQVDQIDPPTDAINTNAVERTTGMDGKSYPATLRTVTDQRPSLPAKSTRIREELRRITNRLEQLVDDDRFDRNRQSIAAPIFMNELRRAELVVGELFVKLNEPLK